MKITLSSRAKKIVRCADDLHSRGICSWFGSVLILVVLLLGATSAAPDPRILVFEKFNRAQSYDEIKPLVSGPLGQQFSDLSTKPEAMRRALNYLQFSSYEPRIVEISDSNSFLVLEHTKSSLQKDKRAAYLLSRSDAGWKLVNRPDPQSVIKTMWLRNFLPADFNQSSTCSVESKKPDISLNARQLSLKSAVAFRTKDQIEIDLFPFLLKEADLDYWKFSSGMSIDPAAFQSSSLNRFHTECRIIFGLDQNGQITFANMGFNQPQANFSEIWQGPGWAALHVQLTDGKGLPPEFRRLEITHDRIKVQTSGQLDAGGDTIRWNANIDIPLLEKGL